MYPNELKHKLEQTFGEGQARRSFLRQEIVLKNEKGVYEFDFNANKNSVASERKLNQNDLFVATMVGLFLLREDSTKIGTGVLRTNVNSTDFATATGFTPAHLECVYNSYIKADINNNTIYEAIETSGFRKVPTEYMPSSGKELLEPRLVLRGDKKNALTLITPQFSGIEWESVTAGTDNKVVMQLFGFLVLNGANRQFSL